MSNFTGIQVRITTGFIHKEKMSFVEKALNIICTEQEKKKTKPEKFHLFSTPGKSLHKQFLLADATSNFNREFRVFKEKRI